MRLTRTIARIAALGFAAALVVASPGAGVQGPVSINGQGPDLSAFAIVISDTGSCGLAFSGTVVTDPGGGTDTFDIFVTDEGVNVGMESFALPADGAAHPIEFTLAFQHLFVNDDWGVTIEDPGGVGTFVVPDVFPIGSCSIQNIPTVSGLGAAGLGLGILAAGVASIAVRRRRRG